ncbi:hypothetical protein PVAND_011883 [Polypedilum vanderplanki]|uniref:Alpha-L-iduronidase n=1 Tax=Polypedilum vanderplanki TaxID=319348 RepID=A0A9J6CKS6_POLVA|nr:hypothetical protein PVAND_011883 [Polypedilum vanderplanki]
MKKILVFFYCLIFIYLVYGRVNVIDYEKSTNVMKRMPKFWTNTGFAPTEPINNVFDFFETKDLNMNLEIIGSMPNNGLKYIRIHWLLNLIKISGYDSKNQPIFNFEKLDTFLRKMINEYNLLPVIEFMTTLKFKNMNKDSWKTLSYQIITHYAEIYGLKNVAKWKFESWNEPDLKNYNKLNFTLSDYLEYIYGIKEGLELAERNFTSKYILKLRGPAGLFKDEKNHKFCWSVLEKCNQNITNCPIDIITFHRKGNGIEANEIIDTSFTLIDEFSTRFKNLSKFKYSNTEADPIKTWSQPRDFQSDTRYASILVETIFQYWKAKFEKQMTNLESISHDNSFMNFYPNIFTQRTLLARFQMNNSVPIYSQIIQKPVYSALGLIANLAKNASNYQKTQNLSYLITTHNGRKNNKFYSCIIILTHVNTTKNNNRTKTIEIEIKNLPHRNDLHYFVEVIDNKRTNPSMIYQIYNKPIYPDQRVFEEMRKSQNPRILEQPTQVIDGKIFLNAQLMEPFIISIRICSKNIKRPIAPFNLRIRQLNLQEIILFWSDYSYKMRCIKTYELFFKYEDDYQQIETKNIPFLYYQLRHSIPGCFKVRSLDINHQYSDFSKETCFNTIKI